MDPEVSIRRMADEGLVSAEQIALLRDCFAQSGSETALPHSGVARVRGIFLALAVLSLIAAIVMLAVGGTGSLSRTMAFVLAIGLILIVPLLLWGWMRNSLVAREEAIFSAWAELAGSLWRRCDVIPSMVEAVARGHKNERQIAELIGETKTVTKLLRQGRGIMENEGQMKLLYDAQAALVTTVAEAVGELADDTDADLSGPVSRLKSKLEVTQADFDLAHMRFNEVVGEFQVTTATRPWSLVASVSEFRPKLFFGPHEDAELP